MYNIFEPIVSRRKQYLIEIERHSGWMAHSSEYCDQEDGKHIEDMKRAIDEMDKMIAEFIHEFDNRFPEI